MSEPLATELTVSRDCPATAIPAGTETVLARGTRVFVIQALGGNVTVRTDAGLFRIAGDQAGAIEGLGSVATDSGLEVAEFSEAAVWEVLKTCFDPEIPVNIVDLGLIYDLAIESGANGGNKIEVKMTLTAPGCGMGPAIAEDARQKILRLPKVESARVHIVWDPQWNPQMISEAGRRILGIS